MYSLLLSIVIPLNVTINQRYRDVRPRNSHNLFVFLPSLISIIRFNFPVAKWKLFGIGPQLRDLKDIEYTDFSQGFVKTHK